MFKFITSGTIFSLLLFLAGLGSYLYFFQLQAHQPFAWELRHYLLGQKMNQGFILYQDIVENIAPLAAYTYSLLHFLAVPLQLFPILGAVLIGLQGLIFQRTIQRFDLLPNLGYLPFFVYVSLFFVSKELWTFSPALLGLTFMLLAWSEIIYQQRGLNANDRVFLVGIFLGMASLFFLSYTFFIFWGLYALIGYTGVNLRQILLYLVGFLAPFIGIISWLNYNDSLGALWEVFRASAFTFHWNNTENFSHIFLTYLPGLLLMLLGFHKLATSGKIRANAQKAQQTNFGWLLISLLFLYSIPNYTRNNLVVFLPAFCLLGLQVFTLYKSKVWKEAFVWLLAINLFICQQIELKEDGKVQLQAAKLPLNQEKLLVLGPQMEEYLHNQMSGPFINWDLSKNLFENLNDYEKVILLTNLFEKDPPHYIYDPDHTFKNIKSRIPNIASRYVETQNNLFQRVR